MAETSNIAEIAEKVSKEVFKRFGWELSGPKNENYVCHKAKKHNQADRQYPKHPCDAVFRYFDPYLNKNIYLLTDLKSYAKDTISVSKVRDALKSLARAVDCASSSNDWQSKYVLDEIPFEVRGLLFIYNHDGKYEKDLLKEVSANIRLDNLDIAENQQLHIMASKSINYLRSVVQDMNNLHLEAEFPRDKYSFFYPDMRLNKANGDPSKHPAVIESLCGPFMVAKYPSFKNPKLDDGQFVEEGHVVYYSLPGDTEYEFMYLLDYLSTWQILAAQGSIKIRIVCPVPNENLKSHFTKAKNMYLGEWGEDETRRQHLERIELETANMTVPNYVPGIAGWT